MNLYLEKIARMKSTGKLISKARDFIHGGSDELDAMRKTREVALKSLKAVPASDTKTRDYLKGAFKDIYKDHLGTGHLMGLHARASGV